MSVLAWTLLLASARLFALLRVQAAVQTQSGEPVTSSDGRPLSRP